MTTGQTHDRRKRQALEGYLVAAARTGDRDALDQLVRLVGPRLLAHATRLLGDPEAARDIVQAAWVDIIRALPTLRAVGAFRSFALQIVTRRIARTIKQHQRDRMLAADYLAETDPTAPPLGEVAADQASVRAAIDVLPPAHRATLALFYLDDLTVAEVATALDVPPGTVKTRLMHARDKLRVILKGNTDDKD